MSVLSHAKGHRHNNLSSRLVAKLAKIVIKIHVHIYIYIYVYMYNFTCCFVWAWNVVSHVKGRIDRRFFKTEKFLHQREEKWERIGGGGIVTFVTLLFTKYLDEKNMNDVGRACSTHGTDEKPIKNIGRPERKRLLSWPKRWWITVRWILKRSGCENEDWIYLADNGWRLWTVELNFWFINGAEFLGWLETISFPQERVCFMDFISYMDTIHVWYSIISKNYTIKLNLQVIFFHVSI